MTTTTDENRPDSDVPLGVATPAWRTTGGRLWTASQQNTRFWSRVRLLATACCHRAAITACLTLAVIGIAISPAPADAASSVPWETTSLIDHQPPYSSPADPTGISCPTSSFCAAVDSYGNIITSTTPTAGVANWHEAEVGMDPNGGNGFTGISCPGEKLCIAVDANGYIWTSAEPTAGAAKWSSASVANSGVSIGFQGVACASESLCVAANGENVAASTDPGGGAGAWTVTKIDGGHFLTGIACTPGLCVAIDNAGNILSSTEPSGGASKWRTTIVDESHPLDAISCPSSSLCVATNEEHVIYSSTEPTGGASSWSRNALGSEAGGGLRSVACATTTLCVAATAGGYVYATHEPTAGTAAWKTTTETAGWVNVISCAPGTTMCVGFSSTGWGNSLDTTNDPLGGGSSWTVEALNSGGSNGLDGISCPSLSLCVAVDTSGNVMTSTSPAHGAWVLTHLAAPGSIEMINAISCPTTTLCVAVDGLGEVITSTNPTGGAPAWHAVKVDANNNLRSISCPTTSLCVAGDMSGHIVTSTDPTGGAGAWTTTTLGGYEITAVSCSATGTCAATEKGFEDIGVLYTSSDPTGGFSAWHDASVFGGAGPSDVACAGGFCIWAGESTLATSIEPASLESAWDTGLPAGARVLYQVACVSPKLCVGEGLGEEEAELVNRTYVSTNPAAGPGSWALASTGDSLAAGDLSCSSAGICAAVDYSAPSENTVMLAAPTSEEAHKETGSTEGSGDAGDGGTGSAPPAPAHLPTTASQTPAPVAGDRETLAPVSGTVTVRIKGASRFVALSGASSLPDGSEVEATHGRVIVTVATPTGTASAEAYGGRFRLQQERTGREETHFVLSLPLMGCPSVALPRGTAAVAKTRHGPKSRHLWVSEHGGAWGTNGRYVSTTVEGTWWLTQDECDQSLVQVAAGKVKVLDLVSHKTKTLTVGEHYTATSKTGRA